MREISSHSEVILADASDLKTFERANPAPGPAYGVTTHSGVYLFDSAEFLKKYFAALLFDCPMADVC